MEKKRQKKPDWLKRKITSDHVSRMDRLLRDLKLNTVCEEAICPNKLECFGKKTATFLIMGDKCTRNCLYCGVGKETPLPLDKEEPKHIGEAVFRMGLRHAVLTSVTRDDIPDGGASHFAECMRQIRRLSEHTTIEVLIPDFIDHLDVVIKESPSVLNHNIEACKSVFQHVRPKGDYQKSLNLLQKAKEIDPKLTTKSGFMVGLGESKEDVNNTLNDLFKVGCDFVTIGQYLQPTKEHMEPVEFVHPDVFKEYEDMAYEIGFTHVASGPFVRSSYNAKDALDAKKEISK